MLEYVLRIVRSCAIVAAVAATALVARAEDEMDVSVEVGSDILSKYVWRGQLLTDDPVIQPSVTVGAGGLSLNVWGSIDTTDINEDDQTQSYYLQEVDYTLSYGLSLAEGVAAEVGVIWYTFAGAGSTGEIYGSVALSDVPLSPSLKVYYDFDEIESIYASFGLEHEIGLTEQLSLTLGASVGYGDADYHQAYVLPDDPPADYDGEVSDVSDAALSATLGYTVNENFSLSVYATYTDFLDSDIAEAARLAYGDSDVFIAGVGAAYSF